MKKKSFLDDGLGFIESNLVELLIKKSFYVIDIDKITYQSNFYSIKENKKKVRIKWLIKKPIIQDKDKNNISFK